MGAVDTLLCGDGLWGAVKANSSYDTLDELLRLCSDDVAHTEGLFEDIVRSRMKRCSETQTLTEEAIMLSYEGGTQTKRGGRRA